MSDYMLSDILRRLERVVVVTTVIELDRANGKAKVKWSDDATSDWLPIAQLGSNALKVWFPPEAGTQVVVLSPGGDTTKGIVYPGPFMGSPPSGNFDGVITGDGDVVASSISLVDHVHGGISPGPADTGKPK